MFFISLKLWDITSSEYMWAKEGYDDIFCLCKTLAKYHITFHPFCEDEDANHYHHCKICDYMFGDDIVKNLKCVKTYCDFHHKLIQQDIAKLDSSICSSSALIGGIGVGWIEMMFLKAQSCMDIHLEHYASTVVDHKTSNTYNKVWYIQ